MKTLTETIRCLRILQRKFNNVGGLNLKKLKKLKLKKKLIIAMVLLAIIPIICYGIISYYQARSTIKENIIKQNNILASQLADRVREKVYENVRVIEQLADLDNIKGMDKETQEEVLDKYLKNNPMFEAILVADQDDKLFNLSQPGMDIDMGLDLSNRNWLKGAKKGYTYISNSSISQATKQPIITIATPIKEEGKIIGTLATNIRLSVLQTMANQVDLGQEGYVFITDGEGVVITHPDYEDVVLKRKNVTGTTVVEQALAGEEGNTIYENVFEQEMLASYQSLNGLGWSLVAQQTTAEAFQDLNRIIYINVFITLVVGGLAAVVAWYFATSFSLPIIKVAEGMKKTANGNLRYRLNIDREDELGDLAKTFNQASSAQNQIFEDLLSTTDNLSAYSQQLSASAEEGSSSIDTNNQGLREMIGSIQEISAGSQEVSTLVQNVNTKVDSGNQNIQDTSINMMEVGNVVNQTVEVINDLDSNSQEIGAIVEFITNIAEQTNLLALNAAIEAARAGEHGKGFAVVADEIRELAEETAKATENISNLIERTQKNSDQGLEAITEVRDKTEKGLGLIMQTGQLFQEIRTSIAETASYMEQVASSTQNLSENSDQIKSGSDDIAAMSEEVSNSAQELSEIAQLLQSKIDRFKL